MGSIGVRSVSARLAAREARLKALVRELLSQAQLASKQGDQQFKAHRLREAERVLARLGPAAGQSQLRSELDRLWGRSRSAPAPKKKRRGSSRYPVQDGRWGSSVRTVSGGLPTLGKRK